MENDNDAIYAIRENNDAIYAIREKIINHLSGAHWSFESIAALDNVICDVIKETRLSLKGKILSQAKLIERYEKAILKYCRVDLGLHTETVDECFGVFVGDDD